MLRHGIDAALAVSLAAIALVEIWVPLPSAVGDGSPAVSTVVAVIACLALAFRRRWPLATALVVMLAWPVAFMIQPILILFWGQLVPIVVATYSVARYASRRGGLIGLAVAAACMLFFDLRVAELQDVGEIVFHWLAIMLAWLIGLLVRGSERRAAASRVRAIEVEAESRTRVLTAIADERARIARELHDIVAHAVTVMIVQAGAAEQVVADDPDHVREALATIRSTGADALAEMRRLVAMLRENEDNASADFVTGGAAAGGAREKLRPQPGLGEVAALVEDARGAGLDVRLTIEGEIVNLPAGVDLAAYRIVQEALTNVRRHASATRVDVRVHRSEDAVRVTVADDGNGGDANGGDANGGDANGGENQRAGGHGLIGMRERVALYGGELQAAGTAAGFTVHATLPVGVS